MAQMSPMLKAKRRLRRKRHIRRTLRGTAARPRVSVYRSASHIYAQIINDDTGTTLCAANTLQSDVAESLKGTGNRTAAEVVGRILAQKAVGLGVTKVVFDRNGFRYHGRVKALADAARAAGLEF